MDARPHISPATLHRIYGEQPPWNRAASYTTEPLQPQDRLKRIVLAFALAVVVFNVVYFAGQLLRGLVS